MPATSPQQIHQLVADAFAAGDVDAYLALCEPEAIVRPRPDQVVAGADAIRDALAPLLAMKPAMPVETTNVLEAGDIALLCSAWELTATDPDGNEVRMDGRGTEVVRRGADGNWRLVVDNPFGTG